MYFILYTILILCDILMLTQGRFYDKKVKGNNPVKLDIDETIHLGPRGNQSHMNAEQETMNEPTAMPENLGVTHFEELKPVVKHKVKEKNRINDFTVHVFKQTMKVFDDLEKKMSNPVMQDKVKSLSRTYRDKFTEFVQETRETNVKTKTGDQKVIFHTIDTSHLITQRLINFLKGDMEKIGIARVGEKNLQKEIDDEKEFEYKHVCTKFGYCRSTRGFSNMLQEVLKILIKAPNPKLRQAIDAGTEVVSSSDYSPIIDSKSKEELKKKIKWLEKADPDDVRKYLPIILGLLRESNLPIVIEGKNEKLVKKTNAFHEIMDILDIVLPNDEANRLDWDDIIASLKEWAADKRTDVLEIFTALNSNFKKGLDKMNDDLVIKMKEQIKIIRE